MTTSEFYIGWMPKAPFEFARHIRKVLLILLPLVLIVAYLLSSSQKKFSTANFEFGKITKVTGIYINKPLLMLKVSDGKSGYVTVPLVGYGKHGAETAITNIEKEKNISLLNKEVTLKGSLLYSGGKTLLQVSKDDNMLVNVGKEVSGSLLPQQKDLGVQTIKGEIIDPKCYFGVMKPGEGKVHRDCAIRCILGGMPPVLHVQNDKGESNYYILVGPNGERMNEAVKDFVAEPIEVNARVVQQDDWIVLYVNDSKFNRISYARMIGKDVLACSDKSVLNKY
ncbi:MAG: hypothetical protein ACM3H8_09035 [Sphingobacteriales bacterium]